MDESEIIKSPFVRPTTYDEALFYYKEKFPKIPLEGSLLLLSTPNEEGYRQVHVIYDPTENKRLRPDVAVRIKLKKDQLHEDDDNYWMAMRGSLNLIGKIDNYHRYNTIYLDNNVNYMVVIPDKEIENQDSPEETQRLGGKNLWDLKDKIEGIQIIKLSDVDGIKVETVVEQY